MSGAPPGLPEIVVDDVAPTHAEALHLQSRLAPGGRLIVRCPRRPRRLARVMRHYFEGGPTAAGQRYNAVQAPRRGAPLVAYRRGPGLAPGHFNDLGGEYADEMPPHLAAHYLAKKMRVLERAVGPGAAVLTGLDVGCGLGAYARAARAALGARIVAVDAAPAVVAAAHRAGNGSGVALAAAQALQLPFGDESFDFAYAVNMVHHLKRGEQALAIAEILRVLRPGAPLVVFEINVLNPLFRFYMRHVFPRTRRIDRGDEEFLTPGALEKAAGQRPEATSYSTFLPDFTPAWLLGVLRPLERGLEAVAGPMAIHYAAVLRRPK